MKSATESNCIVNISNLSISFKTRSHFKWTFKDHFIEFAKSPIAYKQQREVEIAALKNISLQITHGQRVGIIGMNGSGKTTLCKAIAGLYPQNNHCIQVNGKIRAIFDPVAGIFPELTGKENIEILVALNYPEYNQKEFVERACEFSELGKRLDEPFKTYSRGMKARIGLSVAALKGADLLILDEVFEGADRFFSEKFSNRIQDLINQAGAVLFVSHSSQQILKTCNRAILIANGEVHFDGDPRDALKCYIEMGQIFN